MCNLEARRLNVLRSYSALVTEAGLAGNFFVAAMSLVLLVRPGAVWTPSFAQVAGGAWHDGK